ncbi:hypothetical protein M404DRAFT_271977 [Pisolithus tinctorius Marx 270]|uniref:Uncharacterized protein n=1 Tax=Pisolithus tinctorius Marx 270 TaxID=870435 RepID=A0A0C3P7Y7_PISTI|nr:hypothetical protein M404DRAFT_271977 [Pisolithus tinctorius Marx 270]
MQGTTSPLPRLNRFLPGPWVPFGAIFEFVPRQWQPRRVPCQVRRPMLSVINIHAVRITLPRYRRLIRSVGINNLRGFPSRLATARIVRRVTFNTIRTVIFLGW